MFFNIYIWIVWINRVLEYVNPFYWLNKTTSFKEHKAQHGILNMNRFTDELINNPEKGLVLNEVNYIIGGLFTIIEIDTLGIIMFLFKSSVFNILDSILARIITGVGIILIAIRFNHVVLYRNDRYMVYFANFDKLSDNKKLIYGWLCFGIIILIWLLFFVVLNLQGIYANHEDI